MRVIALQYHDVIGGDPDASGMPGADSATYKLGRDTFAAHVAAVSAVVRPPAVPLAGIEDGAPGAAGVPVVFTFDDGGVSAFDHAAPLLEAHGWRGVFLMTTNWIGRTGFLSAAQLRALADRGHVIGAHSCSHPTRFAQCTPEVMRAEWRGSVERLQDVLGRAVTVASVPGGYYARAVADAAGESGLRTLFTSEPTVRVATVAGCRVVGRFTLRSWSPPASAARLAAGARWPRASQWMAWNTKKAVKAIGGRAYLRARALVFQGPVR